MKALTLLNNTPYLTPDSAVTHCRNPFFVPDGVWLPRVLIGIKIDRLGMKIGKRFAHRYYSEVLSALHPTPAGPEKNFEWMRDGALIISDAVSRDKVSDLLLEEFDEAVSLISQFMTLKTGDLILLPSPVIDTLPTEPIDQGVNLNVSDVPAGFPSFILKAR